MKKFAQAIRVITVPTILFFVLLLLTKFLSDSIFVTLEEFLITLFLIGVVPILAYLVAFILRKVKKETRDDGRKRERGLAFIFSIVGYTLAFILGLVLKFNNNAMIIVATYFFSSIIVTIPNLFKVRASGHAAGMFGLMIVVCYFFGWIYLIPCLILYGLTFWASIYLDRHKVTDLILGTICVSLAFVIAILIF